MYKNCGLPLKGSYMTKNGQPYCSDCHEKRFTEECAKCKKKILSNDVVANGVHYHSECFVCNHCKKQFSQLSYKIEKDHHTVSQIGIICSLRNVNIVKSP